MGCGPAPTVYFVAGSDSWFAAWSSHNDSNAVLVVPAASNPLFTATAHPLVLNMNTGLSKNCFQTKILSPTLRLGRTMVTNVSIAKIT